MNRFTGRDRQGTARTGATETRDVAAFVETRYRQGWRELTVRDADGEKVGEIFRHPDTNERTWWGTNAAGECTGLSAQWCPIHGTCRCPDRTEAMDDPGCPLHSESSTHAEEVSA